jgi:hypothetical protein
VESMVIIKCGHCYLNKVSGRQKCKIKELKLEEGNNFKKQWV